MAYYALVLAGGDGTRLWPLSRRNRPKQLLPLVGSRTMFQMSLQRLAPLFAPEQVVVVTARAYVDELRAQAPQVPAENFIAEPVGRDTGPAAGLGTLYIYGRDREAIVAVLTSDHHIGEPERFLQVLKAAYKLAERDYIVTLGVAPSFPSSGYAYLKRGDLLDEVDGFACYQAAGFCEKPDPLTAAKFLVSGEYSWNSGMLIWRADLALKEFRRQQPALGEVFDRVESALGGPQHDVVMSRWWPAVARASIDQAIMEGANNMVVMPVDIGWSDVGSWNTLYAVLKPDENENVRPSSFPLSVQIGARGTFVMSERMVVIIGVEDLVIVDTEDVLLVCRRDQSEDVRQVVEMLKEWGQENYL
jgi:mannose-1-phosphate guanylyltransferase